MTGPGLIQTDWPDLPSGVGACTTTRAGGVSRGPFDDGQDGGGLNLGRHVGDEPDDVERNRALLQAALPGRPAWISQVHGVAVADAALAGEQAPVMVADASVASAPGVVCAVMTADCLPVLFADLDGKVVGAAHAGWRGLAAGVLRQTVTAMRARGAGELTAWLGPAIGPSQFEVGADVLNAFMAQALGAAERTAVMAAFRQHGERPGKYLADIYALARLALARDGVTRVSGGNRCTASEAQQFYSYRRDNVTGRQATLIWIK
jgi:YfiH family protein